MMKKYYIIFLMAIVLAGGWLAYGFTQNKSKKENQYTTVFCVPVTTNPEWYNSDNIAPLFAGLK